MTDPGASADEIRDEIFEEFSSRLANSDIDEEVANIIESTVLSKNPPGEFSDKLIDEVLQNNEA